MLGGLGGLAQLLDRLAVAGELAEGGELGGQILVGPGHRIPAVPGRGLLGEVGVVEVGAGKRHEIGAPRGHDGVDLVPGEDVAGDQRRHARLDPHLLGERGLEHAAVDRLLLGRCLAGRDVDQVDAVRRERLRDRHRVVPLVAAGHPVVRRDADRDRPVVGPCVPHRVEHLERVAEPVLQAAAIFVGPPVRGGREEPAEKIAVRAVKLGHVEAGPRGALERGDELIPHPVHVGAVHLARNDGIGQIGKRRRGDDLPPPLLQRLVDPVPGELRRPLAPGMADLHAELRRRVLVHEIGDPFPRRLLVVVPDSGAAGRDPRVGSDAAHLGIDQPGTAQRAAGEVDVVPLPRHAVLGAILAHGGDRHPVLEPHGTDGERGEHRRRGRVRDFRQVLPLGHAGGEFAVDRGDEVRVAGAQIVVGDRLGAGQQAEGELGGLHVPVTLDLLEPGERDLGRVLQPAHLVAPVDVVGGERVGDVVVRAELLEQRDRVLHRELGARADREMRGVGRIAHDHHVVAHPGLAADGREVAPERAVDDHRMAVEQVLIQRAHIGDGRLLVLILQPGAGEGVRRGLDDPGAHVRVVLVGVEVPDAGVVLAEVECEGGQRTRAAEPDELVGPPVVAGAETVGIFLADPAVDPVAGDRQVRLRELAERAYFALELHGYAKLAAAILEEQEQRLARHAAEPVPAGRDPAALEEDVDVVPVGEPGPDRVVARRVVVAEMPQRLGRKHHAEAERVVVAVLLVDRDLVTGIVRLHQEGEIKPRRAPAYHLDLHCRPLSDPRAPNDCFIPKSIRDGTDFL